MTNLKRIAKNVESYAAGVFISIDRLIVPAVVSAVFILAPAAVFADKGDCGQPLSTGSGPVATDARRILTTGVGATTRSLATDGFPDCICDVNGDGTTNATDALSTLRKAVGQAVILLCQCAGTTLPPTTTTIVTTTTTTSTTTSTSTTTTTLGGPVGGVCGSISIATLGSSTMSLGSNGSAHNAAVSSGATTTFDILRRCTSAGGTQSSACSTDADCNAAETCEATCDCDDPSSPECEFTGPNGQQRCLSDGAACTTNGDCGAGGDECVHLQGAPQPVFAAGLPFCLVSRADGETTGTLDPVTGRLSFQGGSLTRVHAGQPGSPCPTCDTGSSFTRQIGASGTCSGDTDAVGQPCTVDGVHADGNTSLDCLPRVATNIAGPGMSARLNPLTTESVSKTALQVCSDVPLHPNGQLGGFCADTINTSPEVCTSNGDCLRCTNDQSPCTGNGDCSGGTCAAAPAQPIACGFYCHVGFCELNTVQDPNSPCFDDGDCSAGEICAQGSGGGFGGPNPSQGVPNPCANTICGQVEAERCDPTDTEGHCDGNQNVSCSQDAECTAQGAGTTCIFSPKRCFEHTVAGTGTRSALGSYCVENNPATACTSSTDCGGTLCAADSAAPSCVAVLALSGSVSSAVNFTAGLPGPGRLVLDQVIRMCRCGDGQLGCGERCDDGNNVSGDGCSRECLPEP